jgi:hypothetical protein
MKNRITFICLGFLLSRLFWLRAGRPGGYFADTTTQIPVPNPRSTRP